MLHFKLQTGTGIATPPSVRCCDGGTTFLAGVLGSFPASNQRTSGGYGQWLKDIRARIGDDGIPWGARYPVHRTNDRLEADIAFTIKYEVPILISNTGITREVTDAVRACGGSVFHDAINVRHARKALEASSDGIIAVAGGAGDHSGKSGPFAFLGELKTIMSDRTPILAGCMSDGQAVAGTITADADLACVGSRFVNTVESIPSEKMKRLMLASDVTDVVHTDEVDGAFSGFPERSA